MKNLSASKPPADSKEGPHQESAASQDSWQTFKNKLVEYAIRRGFMIKASDLAEYIRTHRGEIPATVAEFIAETLDQIEKRHKGRPEQTISTMVYAKIGVYVTMFRMRHKIYSREGVPDPFTTALEEVARECGISAAVLSRYDSIWRKGRKSTFSPLGQNRRPVRKSRI
jgi:hypothetical protein